MQHKSSKCSIFIDVSSHWPWVGKVASVWLKLILDWKHQCNNNNNVIPSLLYMKSPNTCGVQKEVWQGWIIGFPCGVSYGFRQAPSGRLSLQHRPQISLKVIQLTHVRQVQRCSLMAVQQIDRLTGASRHACWRCQFNTPDCAQPHDDGLRAICHALWLRDIPGRELFLQPELVYAPLQGRPLRLLEL